MDIWVSIRCSYDTHTHTQMWVYRSSTRTQNHPCSCLLSSITHSSPPYLNYSLQDDGAERCRRDQKHTQSCLLSVIFFLFIEYCCRIHILQMDNTTRRLQNTWTSHQLCKNHNLLHGTLHRTKFYRIKATAGFYPTIGSKRILHRDWTRRHF